MAIVSEASPAPISLAGGSVTVILLHGFTGSPAEMALLADALHAKGYSVEVPLLLGHGTQLNDLLPIRPQQWIDQVDGLLRTQLERGQQVVLGGLSMGSILALQAAFRFPEIRGLMLYSPPIGSRDVRRFFAPLLIRLVKTVAKPPCDYADPRTADRLWSYDRYPVICSSLVLRLIAQVRQHLAAVHQPMLVVASRRDNVVTERGVRRLMDQAGASSKQLVWLERSSHAITADAEWPLVCESSLRFLSSLASAGLPGRPCNPADPPVQMY